MGMGSSARSRIRLLEALSALIALFGVATLAVGQHYIVSDGGHGVPAYSGGYVGPGYDGGYCDPAACDHGHGHMGPCDPRHAAIYHGPMPMGAGGTCPPVGYDLMNDVGIEGPLVDQRGPHYFDARIEAVWLTRDETFGRNIPITSNNILVDPSDPLNQIVLSTGDLDYDTELGFRVMGRYDICPLSVLEFGYMAVYDYRSEASVFDPDADLFSLFSEFGTNPPTVALPGGPMPETERAVFHSIRIDSDLQSAEISYRRYWVGFSPRISGTLLAGFRYTKLNESFVFSSIGSEPSPTDPAGPPVGLDYFTRTDNNLAGFQTGADMWIGLSQGLRLGLEGKAGIYNNHYTVTNQIVTSPVGTTPPTLFEEFRDDVPAFIGEMSIDLVADILPSWSFRVGYEVLVIDSLALAGNNFNTASPFGLPTQEPRVPFVDDDGDLLFHGGHIGLEFIW